MIYYYYTYPFRLWLRVANVRWNGTQYDQTWVVLTCLKYGGFWVWDIEGARIFGEVKRKDWRRKFHSSILGIDIDMKIYNWCQNKVFDSKNVNYKYIYETNDLHVRISTDLSMYQPANRLNFYELHNNLQILILFLASWISPLVHPYLRSQGPFF